MSILDLISDLTLTGEQYILQKEGVPEDVEEDSLGDIVTEWIDVQEITGTIQRYDRKTFGTSLPSNEMGRNEINDYYAFFEADFEIPEDELGQYRIKHIFPSDPQFIRYFIIRRLDKGLIMENERHHYEMDLELSRT